MSINYNGAIKSLRDIVWGEVANPLSQIEQITLLIFIKLLSERHNELERLKAKKLIFTGEYAPYHFDSLSRLSGYELVDTTRKAIESLSKNTNIDESIRRIYERSYLDIREPRVLSLLISEINKIDIVNIDMGDFYEHLLSALGAQKEMGSFRTPRHLIKFIVDIVDPQIGERVLDPACGTAGFLTAAYIHIRDANTSIEVRKSDSYLDKLNFDQKTLLLNKTIYGYDIDKNMIKFAISNLYLHNIKNPNISQHNTLTSNDSWEEKYDVILTNPPFSTPKGGVKPTDRFTLDSKRTEVLFAEYVIEHLTLNGRAGVIVPEGIIFQSGKAYKELRKWLVENNYLYAVVSLPSGVFNPYAGVKTSILFLDRERANKSDKILFCKVDNDGFDLGTNRKPIDNNDLPEVLRVVKEYKANPDKSLDSTLAYFITKDKIIKSGDYNLTGDRYRETISITNQKWPIVLLEKLEKEGKIEFLRGQGLSKKDLTDEGKNKCIHYGEIYTLYDPIIKDVISKTNFDGKITSTIGDVLVPATTTADSMGIAVARSLNEQGVIIGGDINVIRTRNKFVLSGYLALLISNPPLKIELSKFAKGANILHLSNSDLRKLKIPLPTLSVQQQIVDEIDSYQKIIDGAKQVITNYRPAIKVDPDWEMEELEKLLEKVTENRDPTRETGTVNYIGLENIESGTGALIGNVEGLFQEIKSTKTLFTKGDILFGKLRPNLNKVYLAKFSGVCSTDIYVLRRKKGETVAEFYAYFLRSKEFNNQILGGQSGAQLPRVSWNFVKNLKAPLPPLETQKQIVAQIEAEQKLVNANKELIKLYEQKIKDKISEVWGN